MSSARLSSKAIHRIRLQSSSGHVLTDPQWILDDYSLKPTEPLPHHTVESANELSYHDYALVVTGDVFRWMINYAPFENSAEGKRDLSVKHCADIWRIKMLVKAQVFARMSPDERMRSSSDSVTWVYCAHVWRRSKRLRCIKGGGRRFIAVRSGGLRCQRRSQAKRLI